ncbi:lasso RiPP family leader peptide-containing protein [Terribacillus sp. AE2B 122]|nr:lasso RiPP family leader peptide-containing protein [Terribacillus sp. AE2B 122]VVM34049.1 hypothetical protein [Terribacillus sp. AE2B 122]
MKKKYTAPKLVEVGNAVELTKGNFLFNLAENLEGTAFYRTKKHV